MNDPAGRGRSLVFVVIVAGLALAACGGDGASEPTTVEVGAVDYGFEGLPETVAAGSTLELTNESSVELHELVAIRLPEGETRSVADLVADPEALAAYFPEVATVIIAPPEGDGIAVEGTGVITEPGRYAIVCAIPTGADPTAYMAAAAQAEGGPPDVPGGPPHFVHGMYGELTVTD